MLIGFYNNFGQKFYTVNFYSVEIKSILFFYCIFVANYTLNILFYVPITHLLHEILKQDIINLF